MEDISSLKLMCSMAAVRHCLAWETSLPPELRRYVQIYGKRKMLVIGWDDQQRQVIDARDALREGAKREDSNPVLMEIDFKQATRVESLDLKNLKKYNIVFAYAWQTSITNAARKTLAQFVDEGGILLVGGNAASTSSSRCLFVGPLSHVRCLEPADGLASANNCTLKKGSVDMESPLNASLYKDVDPYGMLFCIACESCVLAKDAIAFGGTISVVRNDGGEAGAGGQPMCILKQSERGCVGFVNVFPWTTNTGGIGYTPNTGVERMIVNFALLCMYKVR